MSEELPPQDLTSDITLGLERVADAFKVLLLDKGKALGLSPIQIQMLVFVSRHSNTLCTVSHLAKEFNLTKATISDAIKTLEKKTLIKKQFSKTDHRTFTIVLTKKGISATEEAASFSSPVNNILSNLGEEEKSKFYGTLSKMILGLHYLGHLPEQRLCYTCSHFESKQGSAFCNHFDSKLSSDDIRLDCVGHLSK